MEVPCREKEHTQSHVVVPVTCLSLHFDRVRPFRLL